jgi:hypothetical protein
MSISISFVMEDITQLGPLQDMICLRASWTVLAYWLRTSGGILTLGGGDGVAPLDGRGVLVGLMGGVTKLRPINALLRVARPPTFLAANYTSISPTRTLSNTLHDTSIARLSQCPTSKMRWTWMRPSQTAR